jgi:hypothetical protein
MTLTLSGIHHHAAWIRNELRFLVASQGGAALKREEYASLMRFLEKLESTDVSVELLRASRVDKAMLEICESSGWPVGASRRAERVLKRWEKRLGSLGELRPGLWDRGGRMHGCKKALVAEGAELLKQHGNTTAISLQLAKKWAVDAEQRVNPAQYGDIGFEVGRYVKGAFDIGSSTMKLTRLAGGSSPLALSGTACLMIPTAMWLEASMEPTQLCSHAASRQKQPTALPSGGAHKWTSNMSGARLEC